MIGVQRAPQVAVIIPEEDRLAPIAVGVSGEW